MKHLLGSALALTVALAAGSAWGYDYTTVMPPPEGEDSHRDIINGIYGAYGTFVEDGLDFDNGAGGITLERVYDFNSGDEILHVYLGDETDVDQIWTDGTVTVTAQVKFARLDQSFGWNENGGSSGTNCVPLLTDADIGGDPAEILITGDYLWCSQPNGDEWWSKSPFNPDGGDDHMVTYFVEGLPDAAPGEAAWLLFWEDLPCDGCDADFNDFVIEVRAIPEPGSVLLVGAGLVGLAAFKRRRPGA